MKMKQRLKTPGKHAVNRRKFLGLLALFFLPKMVPANESNRMLLDQNALLRAKVKRLDAEAESWKRVKIVVE